MYIFHEMLLNVKAYELRAETYLWNLMRKYRYPFLLLLCVGFFLGFHAFYVGLSDINYNADADRYEITLKLFTDDLELAIQKADGINLQIGTKSERAGADSVIYEYVRRHLNLQYPDNSPLQINAVGKETELDVTWLYFESDTTRMLPSLTVTNDMIMEVYDDQTHIVHLKQNGKTTTSVLHKGKKTDTLGK